MRQHLNKLEFHSLTHSQTNKQTLSFVQNRLGQDQSGKVRKGQDRSGQRFLGILRDFRGFQYLADFEGFQGILRNFKGFKGILRDF